MFQAVVDSYKKSREAAGKPPRRAPGVYLMYNKKADTRKQTFKTIEEIESASWVYSDRDKFK